MEQTCVQSLNRMLGVELAIWLACEKTARCLDRLCSIPNNYKDLYLLCLKTDILTPTETIRQKSPDTET